MAKPKARTDRRRVIAGLLLLLLLVGSIAGVWFWPRQDPEVAKIKAMSKELFAEMPKSGLPNADTIQKFLSFKEEADKLSPAQKKAAFQDMGRMMMKRSNAEAETYMALSESEKVKFLDTKIDQMEGFRKLGGLFGFGGKKGSATTTASKSGGAGTAGTGAAGTGAAAKSGTSQSTNATTNAAASTTSGAGTTAANGQTAGNSANTNDASTRQPPSNEDRENRMKQFLNNSTPEARAQKTVMMKDMQARRSARGLPTGGFGGPR